MKFRFLVLLPVLVLLLAGLPVASAQTGVDPTNPINRWLFGEAWKPALGDPPHPTALPNASLGNNWSSVVTGGGTVEIRDDCGRLPKLINPAEDIPCLFVRETLLGGLSGTASRNITHTDEFTWGFFVKVDSFRSVAATKRMFIYGSSNAVIGGGGIYLGIAIEDDGSILVTSNIGAQDSGVDILTGYWYHFLLDQNALTQKVYMNKTDEAELQLIKTTTVAGAWSGFTQWNIKLATGGGGVFKPHEIAVGLANIFSEPITTGEAFVPYEYTLSTNVTAPGPNSALNILFIHPSSPDFLSHLGFRVFSNNPATGTHPVSIGIENSAGVRWQNYTLTIAPGASPVVAWWLQYWPAWVIFLAFVAIAYFIVKSLWQGAKGKIRR